MRNLSFIRNSRERQFAETFFDHDEWEYQPGPYRLSIGGSYRPDFKDNRRECLIEVVGSRQAYNQNKYKYEFFKREHNIPLEFRKHTGEILTIARGVLLQSQNRNRYYSNGTIYPTERNAWDLRFLDDKLRAFFVATRWKFKDLGEWLGFSTQKISCAMQGMNPHCSERYFRAVESFLFDFSLNPAVYPVMEYPHSLPEKISLKAPVRSESLRFALGLPYESGRPTHAQPQDGAA